MSDKTTAPEISRDLSPVPTAAKPHPGQTNSIGQLVAALTKAQATFPALVKDRHVTIEGQRGSYGYNYADLATCFQALRPALNAQGLAVVQRVESGANLAIVETMLAHVSGEWITGTLAMPYHGNEPKSVASAITYARRYGFLALIGAAASEEDDDGIDASPAKDGRTVASKPPRPKFATAKAALSAPTPQVVDNPPSTDSAPSVPNGGDSGHSPDGPVNPYTGEVYPPIAVDEGWVYVWKYEQDSYGWHHGWISTEEAQLEAGMQAKEIKTKRDIGLRLQDACTNKTPAKIRVNDRGWVMTIELLGDPEMVCSNAATPEARTHPPHEGASTAAGREAGQSLPRGSLGVRPGRLSGFW